MQYYMSDDAAMIASAEIRNYSEKRYYSRHFRLLNLLSLNVVAHSFRVSYVVRLNALQ